MIERYIHPTTVLIRPIGELIRPSFIAQAKWQENPNAQRCRIIKAPDNLKPLEGKEAMVLCLFHQVLKNGDAIVDERNVVCVEA